MRKQPTTEEIVAGMLVEPTGTHFLDSGGAYGRHWQRNQGRTFADEPSATLTFQAWPDGKGWMDLTVSVYHFLVDHLDYDHLWQRRLDIVAERNPDDSWFKVVEKFFDRIKAKGTVGDLTVVNTYNEEDLLSQVVWYAQANVEYKGFDGLLIVVMVHGGCDVRGGYSSPKCFTGEEWPLSGNAQAFMGCSGAEQHRWYTDDAGSHWYSDDAPDLKDVAILDQDAEQFEGNPIAEQIKEIDAALERSEEQVQRYCDMKPKFAEKARREHQAGLRLLRGEREVLIQDLTGGLEQPVIFVAEGGVGLCPVCGAPLSAFSY